MAPSAKAVAIKEGLWATGLLSGWALAEQIGIVMGVLTGLAVCMTAIFRFLITYREWKDRNR